MIPIAKVHCTQVSSLIFPGALPSPAGSLGQLRFVPRKLLVESVDIRTYDVCIPSRHELSVSHGLLSALHAIPHSLSLSCHIFASSSFCYRSSLGYICSQLLKIILPSPNSSTSHVDLDISFLSSH